MCERDARLLSRITARSKTRSGGPHASCARPEYEQSCDSTMPHGSLSWLATHWVTSDGLLSIFALLEAQGRSTAPVRQAGKLPPDFEARCPRVSFLASNEVWRQAIGIFEDPGLGIRAAEVSLRRQSSLVDYLVRASPTLAQALLEKARFTPLEDELRRSEYREVGDKGIFSLHGSAELYLPAVSEFVAARLVGTIRQLSGGTLSPAEVRFRHDKPGSTAAQYAFFSAPLAFRANAIEIVYPLSQLQRPLITSDPGLYKLLLGYAQQQLAESQRRRCTAERVRELVARLWQPGGGDVPDRTQVAKILSVTPRTLSRWLKAEGRTYSCVVDEFRSLSAASALQKGDSSLSDIAQLHGFADQAAFTHAFRRWTGMTPGQYRRLHAVRSRAPK